MVPTQSTRQLGRITRASWFPYVAPMAVFAIFTYAGVLWADAAHVWYGIKTIVVGLMLVAFRRRYREVSWTPGVANWAIGTAAGILVLVVWVAPEGLAPFLRIGQGRGFDPHGFGLSAPGLWAVIGVRLLGASVVVPVMEELFWRGFLMRALIDWDFERVPLGTYRLFSFALVAVAFGFEHDRWLVGIAAGLAYNGLLVWRRSLFTCMIAHAVTNLGLGIYVLQTQRWSLW
jgi:uncharacterized protein